MTFDDRGRLLGEGVFETILVARGRPIRLGAHLARLEQSAAALGLPPVESLGADVWELFEEAFEEHGEPTRAVLRVTLTRLGGRGLVPLRATGSCLSASIRPLPDEPERTPLHAVTVTAHRVDPGAAISGHKVVSWMPWILARREARTRGADVALVRTVDGDVCEADHANLFVRIGTTVVTPSLDRGVLPGITRASALEALRDAGHAVEERALADDDLASADEAWLTSSLDGVRGLASIDGRSIAAPAEVTIWLADCIDEL